MDPHRLQGGYPTQTRWSVLHAEGSGATEAFNYFYARYRGAVAALFRRMGLPPGCGADEVEDLVHTFFLEAFQKQLLADADPEKGRFRAYLKTVAKRYLVDQKRKAGAAKRRPAEGVAPLDALPVDPADGAGDPEQAFDLAWATAVLDAARERLRRESATDHQITLLRSQGTAWQQVADQVGLAEPTVRRRYREAKQQLARHIREEVGETVSDPGALEQELAELQQIFARRSG